MAPKTKGKKAKGESEEERLAREEEEKRVKDAEAKRMADEAEKLRIENLRIRTERRAFRSAELASLGAENVKLLEKLAEIDSKMTAEIAHEVAAISISYLSPSVDQINFCILPFQYRLLIRTGINTEIQSKSQMH